MNKDKILGHLGIEKLHLANGAHASRDAGVCLMEAVAWFAGEEHSDRPGCTSPVLAAYARAINDLFTDSERQLLVPLIPRLVGTVDPVLDVRRCKLLADSVQKFAGWDAADAAKYAADAAESAKYAADAAAKRGAKSAANAAESAKYAAKSAARYAADAAGYAAAAARYAAAGAAARSTDAYAGYTIVESAIKALSDAIEVL